ncbi:ankyrin repeat domain-containing protein [archaeon]|nr:MAG: ankyrin repeat domain-containing protein [archaeon]
MDIAGILAEADAEVDYDKDEFENTAALNEAIKLHESYSRDDSPTSSAKTGNKNAASILQQAARVIAKEEKKEAAAMFSEAAKDIVNDVKMSADPEAHAMSILADASIEVQALHNLPPIDEDSAESEKDGEEDEEAEPEPHDFDSENNRDLLFACHNGDIEKVKKLLRKDTNILHQDRHGWTGLHWAAAKGFADIIEELIESRKSAGKNVGKLLHMPDNLAGWTALHVACVSNQVKSVEVLLYYGASKKRADRLRELPVDVIGSKKNARVIKDMLERKRRKDTRDRASRTAYS